MRGLYEHNHVHILQPGPLRGGGGGGISPGPRTNWGPAALVNANVDACTVSYYTESILCYQNA